MANENYSNLIRTRPNKVFFVSPNSPKIKEKREKRGGEREREKKRLATVFSFYSVDFRDNF